MILLPALAYFSNSWSELYFAISLPTTVHVVLWAWIPDSPRWLLKKGRIEEAKALILSAAKTNNRTQHIPEDLDQQLRTAASDAARAPPPANWWSLWEGKNAVATMILLHLAFAIHLNNYNGQLLNIRAFGREYLTVNTIIAGNTDFLPLYSSN